MTYTGLQVGAIASLSEVVGIIPGLEYAVGKSTEIDVEGLFVCRGKGLSGGRHRGGEA